MGRRGINFRLGLKIYFSWCISHFVKLSSGKSAGHVSREPEFDSKWPLGYRGKGKVQFITICKSRHFGSFVEVQISFLDVASQAFNIMTRDAHHVISNVHTFRKKSLSQVPVV